VALFETAFYESLEESAVTYSVPYEWKETMGIRRYGFHGASHRAAAERAQELMGRADLRHISCHLGGSSSLAAVRGGVAVDTSFGISPQSGLPQNNRVGDIDAFAVLHMMKKLNLDPDQMAALLGKHSGLAGISGKGGDLRDLTEASLAGDSRSQLAIDVFVRAIRHYVGAFMFSLGGLDAITFSGGIGENSAAIRSAVLKDLSGFGIAVDEDRNRSIKGEGAISADDSAVKVLVIPTNEELIVARETLAVVAGANTATHALAAENA
jgi:acetate kinase